MLEGAPKEPPLVAYRVQDDALKARPRPRLLSPVAKVLVTEPLAVTLEMFVLFATYRVPEPSMARAVSDPLVIVANVLTDPPEVILSMVLLPLLAT